MSGLKAWRRTLLLAGVLGTGIVIAEVPVTDYADAIAGVEQWIPQKYPRGRARSVLEKRLDAILNSQKSEEEQIKELQKAFPEAFKKAPPPQPQQESGDGLIFQPPVSWLVHSLALNCEITDSTTQESKTVDLLKAAEVRSQSSGALLGQVRDAKGKIEIGPRKRAKTSFNPFLWKDNAEVRAKLNSSLSGSQQRSKVWSVKQQEEYRRERAVMLALLAQPAISKRCLTFTVSLTNNGSAPLQIQLSSAQIPVYMGEKSCSQSARPVDLSQKTLDIPARSTKDITFRMDLDANAARRLVDFMSQAAPTIDLTRGNFQVVDSSGSVTDAVERMRNRVPVIPVRLVLPDGFITWSIRRYHADGTTTLGEALQAIQAVSVKADRRGRSSYLIAFDGKGSLATVSGIPVNGTFAAGDAEKRYLAVVLSGNTVLSEIDVKSPLSDQGYTFMIVDLENLSDTVPAAVQQHCLNVLEKLTEEGGRLNSKKVEPGYQYRLERFYHRGWGTEPNKSAAFDWAQKAAAQGYAPAQYDLGGMYQYGEGTAKDEQEAVQWYRKAADQGYVAAQVHLGVMYANGRGVTKDEQEAVKWYRKAANQEDLFAQIQMGMMYANGRGVAKDEQEAVKWYLKAAEQGEPAAQLSLGMMYEKGVGVQKSLSQARYWYQKAAEQENEAAKQALQRLNPQQ